MILIIWKHTSYTCAFQISIIILSYLYFLMCSNCRQLSDECAQTCKEWIWSILFFFLTTALTALYSSRGDSDFSGVAQRFGEKQPANTGVPPRFLPFRAWHAAAIKHRSPWCRSLPSLHMKSTEGALFQKHVPLPQEKAAREKSTQRREVKFVASVKPQEWKADY